MQEREANKLMIQ